MRPRTRIAVVTALTAVLAAGASAETHASPMTVEHEDFFKRWSNGPQDCFYWDDTLEWSAAGSLAPGESFTFVPSIPTCDGAETPVIMAWASWDASQLRITSAMPDHDGISDDPAQIGTPVTGTRAGNSATLCMFTAGSRAYNYAITITNVGTETARDVRLDGAQYNGWPIFYYDRCSRADADVDGWNDSLEHVMGELTYRGYPQDGTYPYDTFMASNPVRATGTSTPDDEVDFSPADLNDDGRVDQQDIDRLSPHLGEGTGVSIDMIGANPGTPNYIYTQARPWRRYDLDGDGQVTAADRSVLERLAGGPIPPGDDRLPPAVSIKSPADGGTVKRGSYVKIAAFAADNALLDRVEFYQAGKLLCRLTDGGVANANNDQPHYRCPWQTPKKRGTHSIEVRARDTAGNITSRSIRVNVN